MNDIKALVNEIVEKVWSSDDVVTKQEMKQEYTEQIQENDADSLINYLNAVGEIDLAAIVKDMAIKAGVTVKNREEVS